MTEIAEKKNRIALSSENGKAWTDINGGVVSAEDVEGIVTRVIIGELGKAEEIEHDVELLNEVLSIHQQTITHLHLWNLKKLKSLEMLPSELECLDLRGCTALTELPELPTTLETLDLEGCESLKSLPDDSLKNLRHLHLDGCTSLDADIVNARIRKSPALRELTLSGLTKLDGLTGLNGPGDVSKDLRKLVLNDCSALRSLPNLEAFELLNHLNLNGCKKLEALPELSVLPDPDLPRRYDEPVQGLRYLVTHNCPNLRQYRDLDVREVHLSRDDDDNIIDTVRAFRYLGDESAELISSKLLLLGSGRVGKTTLAKALQWADLPEEERETDNGRALNPCKRSLSTHGIQFWPWESDFTFSTGEEKRRGKVHIWDFAGQDIYRNTHRLFATSGAVFVIVCCDPETHTARLKKETEGMTPGRREEHLEENTYHEVRFWLDYVRAALGVPIEDAGSLPVILLHSAENRSDSDYLLEQAGPYREFIDAGIPRISLNCSEESYVDCNAFTALKKKLSLLLGSSAEQLGIRVPAFYEDVHKLVERLLRAGDPSPEDAALTYDEWKKRIEDELSDRYPPLAFETSATNAVTRYLHRIGRVFWLDQYLAGDVLIDQKLGARVIYSLCTLYAKWIRDTEGLIDEQELGRILAQELRVDGLDLRRLLRLMVKCDVCAEIGDGQWQALSPSLLPDLDPERRQAINAQWFQLIKQRPGYVNHCYRLSGNSGMMIGSADMQAVMAWLARAVRSGEQGDGLARWLAQGETDREPQEQPQKPPICWRAEWRFWRNGAQILWQPEFAQNQFRWTGGGYRKPEPGESPGDPFLLRVQYAPFETEGLHEIFYAGSLYMELVTCNEVEMGRRLKLALFSDAGPLAFFLENHEIDDRRPDEFPIEWAGHPRDSAMWPWKEASNPQATRERHDVAISVRGTDAETAEALLRALEAEGISAYYYREDERLKLKEGGGESGLLEIYDYLDRAKCLVLVCTTDYFDLSDTEARKGNLYCPVELAEAVCSVRRAQEPRSASRLLPFAVSTKDKPFDWSGFDEFVTETLRVYQRKVIKQRGEPTSDIDSRERTAISDAMRKLDPFLTGCGHQAKNVVFWDQERESLEKCIATLVDKIKGEIADPQDGT